MAEQWYYIKDGEKHGPVHVVNLKRLAQNEKLMPTDLLWKEGLADWVPAGRLKGLF
jgi:hypothetical protein